MAEVVWSVRVDGAGNDACYSIAFPGYPSVAGNYSDALYVASFSPTDGSLLWNYIFAFPGSGRSNVKKLLVDPLDGALIAGGTSYPFSGSDQACGFVAKIDSGTTVWMYVDSAGGCSRRNGFSGVVIGSDNHYYAYGTDYENYSSSWFGSSRRFAVKIDRGAGIKLWNYVPGGYSYTAAASYSALVALVGFGAEGEAQIVDLLGNEVWSVILNNGRFWDVLFAPNGHPTLSGIRNGDFYVAQLQRETGGTRWQYSRNGSNNANDVAWALSTDGTYIYAAGYLDNGINGLDGYVVKLDTLGNLIWSYTYNGPSNSDDAFNSILISPDGGIIVGGYSVGAGTGSDILVVKLDQAGDTLWTLVYDSPYSNNDNLKAMVWGDNALYACADSYSSPTNRDILVLKISDPTNVTEKNVENHVFYTLKGGNLHAFEDMKVYSHDGRLIASLKKGESKRIGKGVYFLVSKAGKAKVVVK